MCKNGCLGISEMSHVICSIYVCVYKIYLHLVIFCSILNHFYWVRFHLFKFSVCNLFDTIHLTWNEFGVSNLKESLGSSSF